jgi:hypothetical protein
MTTTTKTRNPIELTRIEAPDYLRETHGLKVSHNALAQRAVTGTGPRYHRRGNKVYYPVTELDAFAEKLKAPTPLVRNTREAAEARATKKEADLSP